MDKARLRTLLDRFAGMHILVLGDFFLDRYLVLDPVLAERSLETGLVARQVVGIRNSPGAGGTVTNNLCALGAHVTGVATTAGERHGYPVVASSDIEAQLPRTDILVMILPTLDSTHHALDAYPGIECDLLSLGKGMSGDLTPICHTLGSDRMSEPASNRGITQYGLQGLYGLGMDSTC